MTQYTYLHLWLATQNLQFAKDWHVDSLRKTYRIGGRRESQRFGDPASQRQRHMHCHRIVEPQCQWQVGFQTCSNDLGEVRYHYLNSEWLKSINSSPALSRISACWKLWLDSSLPAFAVWVDVHFLESRCIIQKPCVPVSFASQTASRNGLRQNKCNWKRHLVCNNTKMLIWVIMRYALCYDTPWHN